MQPVSSQNDSFSVLVWDNNIEEALKSLHKQTGNSRSFKEIRKPRKSLKLQHRRQIRRLKMFQKRNPETNN